MIARPIASYFPAVLERAEQMQGLQYLINRSPCAAERKRLIMWAWESLAITDEDAELLLQAYGLETA